MAVGATLVGRRSELDAIGQVIDAARSGRSGGLLLGSPFASMPDRLAEVLAGLR